MSIQIAYVKIPVILECNQIDLEKKINNHFKKPIYAGCEYSDNGHDINSIVIKLKEQLEILEKLKEQIK